MTYKEGNKMTEYIEKLDESDQAEIMNLIRFKEQVRAQRTE